MALYDLIGNGYDTTRRADPHIAGRLRDLLCPHLGGHYLDLACGTGNYTVALAADGGEWWGIDPSNAMIGAAEQKSRAIHWLIGQAESLPFTEGTFSGVLCVNAMHHFADLSLVFYEVFRGLAGDGRFVFFTSTAEQMQGYWLNEYFPTAMERSIAQMPRLEFILGCLHNAGFEFVQTEPYVVQPNLTDLFLYSGKHRPATYLDPQFRRGISTFASLADPGEIELGCARLSRDLASGQIREIIAGYQSLDGDYLFAVARQSSDLTSTPECPTSEVPPCTVSPLSGHSASTLDAS